MTYRCNIEIFEGPLDLLLHLIKEQKMDIHDIAIATITRQYMDYIDLMQDLNLEVAGDYLIMAAELTRIKSKVLLPVQEQELEEGEEGQDPRAELMRRLQEYQRYKEAAFELRVREHDRQQVFVRGGDVLFDEDSGEEMIQEASAFDLLNAFQNILKNKEFKKDYEVELSTFSVSDRLTHILEILNAAKTITFDSLFTVLNSRQELVVTFLALLETMRLKLVRIQQAKQFDPIRLYLAAADEAQAQILEQYHSDSKIEK